ncbi:MAG: transposase [Nitrospira sp. CG24B]|nr:MAG: transposase [Nitrospira sp. CG24B]
MVDGGYVLTMVTLGFVMLSQRWGKKGNQAQEAIGRSKGGLTTKIHATCDALRNPTGFHLTPGQAHDLKGADALLPGIDVARIIADKAFDAAEQVIEPLQWHSLISDTP